MQQASTNNHDLLAQEVFGKNAPPTSKLPAYFTLSETLIRATLQPTGIRQQNDPILIKSHSEMIHLIRTLKDSVDRARNETFVLVLDTFDSEFRNQQNRDIHTFFTQRPDRRNQTTSAIATGIQLLFMVDYTWSDKHHRDFNIEGFKPPVWHAGEGLLMFLQKSLPAEQPPFHITDKAKHVLKGWKLRKRANIEFTPTNNLVEHLLYDPSGDRVLIFHHAWFLKEQLRHAWDKGVSFDANLEQAVRMGTLPPRLLLETLRSLQDILFPCWEGKSTKILEDLVSGGAKFDEHCLYAYDDVYPEVSKSAEYLFWGRRLTRLVSVVTEPRPKGLFRRWLQRHTSDRNALYVAIIALIASSVFGFLSVVIGAVQTWIAWRAWKESV